MRSKLAPETFVESLLTEKVARKGVKASGFPVMLHRLTAAQGLVQRHLVRRLKLAVVVTILLHGVVVQMDHPGGNTVQLPAPQNFYLRPSIPQNHRSTKASQMRRGLDVI